MSKTWTAEDLELGKLTINQVGDMLRIERRYKFLDTNSDVITQIVTGRLLLEVEIFTVPLPVLSALQTVDTWTKNQALAQEGME